jgi:hypothetical protein
MFANSSNGTTVMEVPIYGKYPSLPGGISANVILGGNVKKGRTGGNIKEKFKLKG